MLGKQIWRIILYPNSLLSRIFKAKYFPHCDVLDATPNANASITWRSILSALPLVATGIRWRVGNGEHRRMWEDNWIPRDNGMKPFTPDLYDIGSATVANLLDIDGQ